MLQIITLNNDDTLDNCLSKLPAPIQIIDLGSTDETLAIAKKYKCQIIKENEKNEDKIRIKYLKDWNFYVEPWEILFQGKELIPDLIKNKYKYIVETVQGDFINKDIKLFHKDALETKLSNIIFLSLGEKKTYNKDRKYFKAYDALKSGHYQEFINLSLHHLIYEKEIKTSNVMLKYYMGVVYNLLGKYEEAIQMAAFCLSCNLLMAEFWCLLGDIYLKIQQKQLARKFYENALFFGSKRTREDLYPLQISKYSDYPLEKLNSIQKDLL